MKNLKSIAAGLCAALVLVGCNVSNTAKGTAIGAGGGAVVGAIIGKMAGNTAIGAVIGDYNEYVDTGEKYGKTADVMNEMLTEFSEKADRGYPSAAP